MKTFAFVIHPINIEQLKDFWPITRIMPDFLIKLFLKNIPPFKISHIKKVRSIQGKEIEGYFIACPLLPKQMLELEERLVLDKIIAAGRIAERLGARILGLGGYTSIVGDKGYTIAKNLKIPVTSGNAFTAWSVFEAIYRAVKTKNIDLKESSLTIIEATNSVGNACARKLSDYVRKIILTSKNREKLEFLKETILHLNPVEVVIENDTHKAVKDADIVIITTSDSADLFNTEELKPNTIVCDASITKNIADKTNLRPDITVVNCGLIKLPFSFDLGVKIGSSRDIVSASLAETMLLTFEKRFVSYSLGNNINLDNLEEIADIAVQHGFEVWVPEAPML